MAGRIQYLCLPHGYRYIVTYGMTVLYADEEAFGSEWNGWGYEMTMKLTGDDDESNMSAINLLAFLARDTYTRESFIEPFQTIKFSGRPLFQDSGSAITDILIVPDTEVPGVDTVHGRTDFLQLIGITRKELEAIRQDSNLVETLINALRVDYPYLETDPRRAKCFL